ncbi:MDR family MFS transporter [Brochothrix thermosphacta]|uniref:MDR family MFS transporter n=1 Tax=Brochothrix thermosphacta TaxID=2756 RepID=UPI00083F8F94|nr:MDR family MFS transporter [Brochothrix thermosphacta]ODJ63555.1 MFS transporter [Brochothrix thermosphacta]ODJ66610.1 MFS transporter [Brochothrix thermosphacta]SPN73161.1 multidrug-efflux transporter [Brochothrix thermosphacta]
MTDKKIKFVVVGLLLGILMAAMDNTIVATAMGTIVSDLGGLDHFVWVTAAYMVTMMAGMPVFGKLSDMYGRKRFFIFGIVVFLIGSALCGLADSMIQLSIFRAIQGIGGGALMPIAFTIVYDIFPPQQRGKMTGMLGAVFGLSSVMGPMLGAYITDNFSWHWVFYVNVPIGIVVIALIMLFYKENNAPQKQVVDWLGAATLVVAVVSLMFGLELGGNTFAWDSAEIIALAVIFVLFSGLFVMAEKCAVDPILPFGLFKRRLFLTAQIAALLYGATFIILTVYIPIFVQAVYGGSATNAGFILMPMMIGSVVGSATGGIFLTRVKFRHLMSISVVVFFIGMALLSTISADTSRILLAVYMALTGIGVGFSFSILPTASMHQLEPRFRGTATSTNSFIRSFGMTLGIAMFGALQSNVFNTKLSDKFVGAKVDLAQFGNTQQLFESSARAKIPTEVLNKVIDAMASSVSTMFFVALIPIAIAAIAIFMMGNAKDGEQE